MSKGLVTFTSTPQSNFFEVVQVLAIIIVYNLISLYFLSRTSCYCVSFFGTFLVWLICQQLSLQRLAHLLSFGYFSFDSVGWDLQSNVRRSWLIDYGVSNTKETKQILMIKSANNRKFKKKPAFTWRCSRWTLIYRLRCHFVFYFFFPLKMCVQLSRFQIFLTFSAYANTETFLMSFKKKITNIRSFTWFCWQGRIDQQHFGIIIISIVSSSAVSFQLWRCVRPCLFGCLSHYRIAIRNEKWLTPQVRNATS